MQKVSHYSFLLALSLTLSTVHASTVWIFDRGAIMGHVEDEIDKRFQPGLQSEAMKVEIQAFKNDKKYKIARLVEQEHRRVPFRSQLEAKEYASRLAQDEANKFFKKIVRDRIAMKMNRFPAPSAQYKDQVTAAVNTFVENRAAQEANSTGRLTRALQDIDKNIKEALHFTLDWTCAVCTWLQK